MKTFEEILSYHTGYTVDELTNMATSPILQPYDVPLAKKEWEQQVKNLTIPAVVGRSEQLKCAHQWRDSGGYFRCCKCGEYSNATT